MLWNRAGDANTQLMSLLNDRNGENVYTTFQHSQIKKLMQ